MIPTGRRFQYFRSLTAFFILVLLVASSGNVKACGLALVLALDVSQSVDSTEYKLQARGVANAFRHKSVRAVILAFKEPVAAVAFEWSGTEHQTVITDWTLLSEPNEIDHFADRIAEHGRTMLGQKTAIGSALEFSSDLFDKGPDCSRWVIDVSGDGYNSVGKMPSAVYEALDFSFITVNALVIGGESRPILKRYFETEVIRGPDAFLVATESFADYAEAFRHKLLRELQGPRAVAMVGVD